MTASFLRAFLIHYACMKAVSVLWSALQNVESLYFVRDGREFVSCHSDGSYVVRTTSEASRPKEEPKTTYGLCFRCLVLEPVMAGVKTKISKVRYLVSAALR